jgi:hypothetical protein
MLLMSLFSWWYSDGLKKEIAYLTNSMLRSLDYFSIGLLAKTLFAPFRQIDSGKALNAPLDVKARMFFDRLLSRLIGAVMRTLVILIGAVALLVKTLLSLLATVAYLLLPVVPIAGVVMYIVGWVPSWPI